jgi:LemA protein
VAAAAALAGAASAGSVAADPVVAAHPEAGKQDLGIWEFGNLEIWKSGNLEIWKCGNLGMWKFGNVEIGVISIQGEWMRKALQAAVMVLVALALPGCSYNKFTTQEEAIKGAWGEVQNQIQRRSDLIPSLVETVKGFAAHEEGIFKELADARAKLSGATTPAETIAAANQQGSALARLLVVVENYPNLKANEQFNRLMDELAGTNNRLTVARGRYNERIQEYNTTRRRFPSNVTAKVFGFKEYPYYEAPPESQVPPKVDFNKR